MVCRFCVVGFSSFSSCEVISVGGFWFEILVWGSCGVFGLGFSFRSFIGCWLVGIIFKVIINFSLLVFLDLKVDLVI